MNLSQERKKPLKMPILWDFQGFVNQFFSERCSTTTDSRKYYEGLPVTSSSIILPIISAVCYFLHLEIASILPAVFFVMGFMFLMKIKIPKIDVTKTFSHYFKRRRFPPSHLLIRYDNLHSPTLFEENLRKFLVKNTKQTSPLFQKNEANFHIPFG